jgi:hypothetical protein
MTARELIQRRLRNQKLTPPSLRGARQVISWLGAAQAQDYGGAKWAIGLRANGLLDADVERAFNEGAILRTHCLRPTWHFVAPADIRWVLALTAPRVHAVSAYYYRKLEIDARVVARSRIALERALRDGAALTRAELGARFLRAGIPADGHRLAYLMMHAELDAVVCSGPRRGNQFTYALLEERVPRAPALKRGDALIELTRRYFSSRGPATIRDFVWWSGLTVRDAKAGLAETKGALAHEAMDGLDYWFVDRPVSRGLAARAVYLLPNYDELGIAYKDRDAVPALPRPRRLAASGEFQHLLTIDGQFAGRWRRTVARGAVHVDVQPFRPLDPDEERAVAVEAERYGRFVDMPAKVSIV